MSMERCIGGSARHENDFYETPPEATIALLRMESPRIIQHELIWEPACGNGAMSRVLSMAFPNKHLLETDINQGIEFAFERQTRPDASSIALITNPPFNVSTMFIEHAHVLGIEYMALLLKQVYFNAGSRVDLFKRFMPARIYPLAWRVQFPGFSTAPLMDLAWYIWDGHTSPGDTRFMPPLTKGNQK